MPRSADAPDAAEDLRDRAHGQAIDDSDGASRQRRDTSSACAIAEAVGLGKVSSSDCTSTTNPSPGVRRRCGDRRCSHRCASRGCRAPRARRLSASVGRAGPVLERRRRHVRLVQRDPDPLDVRCAGTEIASRSPPPRPLEDHLRQKLRGRVPAGELRHLVEVAEVELRESC